jgi:hypothetical protein
MVGSTKSNLLQKFNQPLTNERPTFCREGDDEYAGREMMNLQGGKC